VKGEAEEAKLTFAKGGLVLLRTAGGEPTWEGPTKTALWTIDLTLGNLLASERTVSAVLATQFDVGSDHRPLLLTLETGFKSLPPPPPCRLFRKADPSLFLQAYHDASSTLPPPASLSSIEALESETSALNSFLSLAVETIPLSSPPRRRFAHHWWNAEIATASRFARRLRNKAHRLRNRQRPDLELEAAARIAGNHVVALCWRERRREERREMEEVNNGNLWKKVKEGEKKGSKSATPPHKKGDGTYAVDPHSKIALLQPILLPKVRPRGESGDGVEEERSEVRSLSTRPLLCPSHSSNICATVVNLGPSRTQLSIR
jgi:hypothetical protein